MRTRTLVSAALAAGAATAAASAAATPTPLALTVLPQAAAAQFGAACLDGTPPAYWSVAGDPTRFIIFIEGGGWCFDPAGPNATIAACRGRAGGYGGSSTGLPATFDAGGLLSTDPGRNPHFYNSTMVFVHYCDGTSHASAVEQPILAEEEGGAPLYLRGRANLRAVFAYLTQAGGLGGAREVILSGGSAGGLTTLLAADAVAGWLPSGARLVAAPDAGFFVDAADVQTGQHTYAASFAAADPAWNASGGGTLLPACTAVHPDAPWRCFLQQYAGPFIRTPLFLSQSAYDMWQVLNDLALGCVPSTDGAPVAGNPSCTPAQMVALQGYRAQQLSALADTLAVPGTGAWVPSCFVHELNVDYCSTQPLPNCVGWAEYAIAAPPPGGGGAGSANVTLGDAFFAWFTAVTANWDAVVAAREAHVAAAETAARRGEPLPRAPPPAAGSVLPAVQVVDAVEYPHNPTCPFPTPKAAAAARRAAA